MSTDTPTPPLPRLSLIRSDHEISLTCIRCSISGITLTTTHIYPRTRSAAEPLPEPIGYVHTYSTPTVAAHTDPELVGTPDGYALLCVGDMTIPLISRAEVESLLLFLDAHAPPRACAQDGATATISRRHCRGAHLMDTQTQTPPAVLTCPWCGHAPHVLRIPGTATAAKVSCENPYCPAMPEVCGDDTSEACAAWNQRT